MVSNCPAFLLLLATGIGGAILKVHFQLIFLIYLWFFFYTMDDSGGCSRLNAPQELLCSSGQLVLYKIVIKDLATCQCLHCMLTGLRKMQITFLFCDESFGDIFECIWCNRSCTFLSVSFSSPEKKHFYGAYPSVGVYGV
eukprot:TRINITY_DN15169_c0_g1_i1.p1 TRINITY_DN15169_c0_g1~~TRINITY_DN15169_c0_g1_i1.p1  ORF type:complete len:140 (+),score=15.12 TRINITY_DN15169_c0_g1_i1:404-823(+)